MTTTSPIQLSCPVCETEFESTSIASCGYASKRTDFRPNYWGLNPVPFFYHCCPSCGFCSTSSFFKRKIDNINFKKRMKNIAPLKQDFYDMEISSRIERAMYCLEVMNEYNIINLNELELANNWINAFWWAKTTESQKRFGKIVLEYFAEAFKKKQVSENGILQILYLRGEINRRIGNKKEANEFFDQVIELAKKLPDPNNISSLAKQQKINPKENLPKN
jgi:hypothetical protein